MVCEESEQEGLQVPEESEDLRPDDLKLVAGGSIEHLWREDPEQTQRRLAEAKLHCPNKVPPVHCGPHGRIRLRGVLTEEECWTLHHLWKWYRDDLRWPWYKKKPEFWNDDFDTYKRVCSHVVERISEAMGRPLVLDQATISATNHIGHPPHADNVQFDSVWWQGKRIREKDQLTAARDGAYPHWRIEKTNYRNYSCTVSLVPSDWYGGGEVQFFKSWGDKDPVASYRNEQGDGIAFCGCEQNIHAVTGVKWGFRLVLLIWTRPPGVFVPPEQTSTCYFRPGTGYSVWLTSSDLKRIGKRRMLKEDAENQEQQENRDSNVEAKNDNSICDKKHQDDIKAEEEDGKTENADDESDDEEITCTCSVCAPEIPKKSWAFCMKVAQAQRNPSLDGDVQPCNSLCNDCADEQLCPGPHRRMELTSVLSKVEVDRLTEIWKWYNDDLANPWYEQKPEFEPQDFWDLYGISQIIVDAIASECGVPLILDQATISKTNDKGFPPHCDNVQLDSVWWRDIQLKKKDELVAVRNGGRIRWKSTKTSHRSHSAVVALTGPEDYSGGDLEFYEKWGDNDAVATYRCQVGDGVAYCGCSKNVHAVTGVDWGFRLVLMVWVRQAGVECPEGQESVCYFRPGTGRAVWLTAAEIQSASSKGPPQGVWCKDWKTDGQKSVASPPASDTDKQASDTDQVDKPKHEVN